MLERLGYQVKIHQSPIAAWEDFYVNKENFDLVITDMTMPKMTGSTLAKKMLKVRSNIPIILCTGFVDLITAEEAKAIGIQKFVIKPILMSEMANMVREVLDKK